MKILVLLLLASACMPYIDDMKSTSIKTAGGVEVQCAARVAIVPNGIFRTRLVAEGEAPAIDSLIKICDKMELKHGNWVPRRN